MKAYEYLWNSVNRLCIFDLRTLSWWEGRWRRCLCLHIGSSRTKSKIPSGQNICWQKVEADFKTFQYDSRSMDNCFDLSKILVVRWMHIWTTGNQPARGVWNRSNWSSDTQAEAWKPCEAEWFLDSLGYLNGSKYWAIETPEKREKSVVIIPRKFNIDPWPSVVVNQPL